MSETTNFALEYLGQICLDYRNFFSSPFLPQNKVSFCNKKTSGLTFYINAQCSSWFLQRKFIYIVLTFTRVLTVLQHDNKSTLKQNGQVVQAGQRLEKTFWKINIWEAARTTAGTTSNILKIIKIFLLIVFLPPVEKLLDQNMRRWEENCYCCHDCERRENDQTKPKIGSCLLKISIFFHNERFDGQNEAEWLQQLISKSVKGFFSQTGSMCWMRLK